MLGTDNKSKSFQRFNIFLTKDGTLIGHIPIELSNLVYYLLKDVVENFVSAVVILQIFSVMSS